jgi:hypothetical protein
MDRIVIVGVSGAGKSTFAKKIHSILGMKVYHLDRAFWQRDWIGKDKETRIDILEHFVQEKRWIIDGNYLSSSEIHLDAADTIIFLDISPFLCLRRLIKRHVEYRKHSRRDTPEGCTDRLTLLRILKVPTFPLNGRKLIKKKLLTQNYKKIIWLQSPKEVEGFLMQLELDVYEMRDASYSEKGRYLVAARR